MTIFNKKTACGAVLLAMCGSTFAASTGKIDFTVQYTKTATFAVKDGTNALAAKTLTLQPVGSTGKVAVTLPLVFESNMGGVNAKLASATNTIAHGGNNIELDVSLAGTKLNATAQKAISTATGILTAHGADLVIASKATVGSVPAGAYSGTVGVTFESEF
ncbi:CS1 type fimbrial major subunit [Chromobacterium amazonense]|uniref:CS1 type fimbrial major subunit n=1 Tax=Chromobacterium amazonense TaxID=1382803 RepID=A0ABU8V203_9NEIS|nr:CS1 type fimbrial major subunit [Chromobacterium amazonense]MDQ4540694.1 CS1 type fimbrial major subunit [Chromobacterium amazonense]